MKDKNKSKLSAFFKTSSVLFLPAISSVLIFLILVSFSGLFWHRQYGLEVEQRQKTEQEKLEIVTNTIDKLSVVAISDLKILSSRKVLQDYLGNQKTEYKDHYAEELINFSRDRKQYDQIRYIDETGQEIIRVNYRGGLSYLTPDEKLQNKSDRYYFKDSVSLDPGQLFISPIDLNVEGGVVEEPLQPTIRLATPVFHNGQNKGIIIMNFLAKSLLDEVDNSLKEKRERIYLLNDESYWLKGPNPSDEWGFMYPDRVDENFKQLYPEIWPFILKRDFYQVVNNEGLFTSHTIEPFKEIMGKDYFWKLVSFLPKESIAMESALLSIVLITVNIVMFLILSLTTAVVTINIKRRLKTEKKVLELNNILKIITKILRHDLANVFTHINLSLELYKENPKDKSSFDEILKSAKNGIDIISQMKDLENMVAGNKELKEMSVVKILEEVIKDYKIKFNISGDATILVDEGIKSVFNNIISNAILHGKTEKMDIEIEKNNSIIRFIDYGIGVEDKIKNKVFDEGFKYGETGNTGLGLYIVGQTIKRYGGKIWVEDNKPKGSIFVIELDSK